MIQRTSLFLALLIIITPFAGCIQSNDEDTSESDESETIDKISEMGKKLDEANNTILELQILLTGSSEIAAGMYWPLRFESYNSTGSYMNHANWIGDFPIQIERNVWDIVTFDKNGIPLVNYSWGTFYVPTTAFHWGLVSYSMWVESGNLSNLDDARKIADWAVENQEVTGAWNWNFSHNFSGGILGTMNAGWPSAMTQGLGMSFLVRMYSATNDTRYLNAALNAIQPLQKSVEEGGVMRVYNDKWTWYELYPTPDNGSYVLNGFIYSLIGLYDNWQILGSNVSKQMYENGIVSLQQMISMFDLGCASSYDLVHLSIQGSAPNTARVALHNLDVSLLSVINAIEDDILIDVEERWFDYAMGLCYASPNGANSK